ncbi:MAG: GTP-binding protein, partial [Leptospiraceae bacterium]|nr:GTP-binding protein [Leptospiraceae bacterium]
MAYSIHVEVVVFAIMKYRQIINFGIFAHIDAGKTTLTERILFQEKVISSLGDVESGTTETDFLEEEISRGISIQSVVVRFEKKFQNTKILCNLIDTPGHLDFDEQVEEALEVIDIAILVVDVNNTIQSQTEVLWEKLNRKNIPIIIFINKIDSTEFDLLKKISEIKKGLSKKIYPAFFLKQNSNQKMESILKAKKADENILIPFIEWNEKLSEKYLQSPENIQSIALEGLQKGFHIREVFPLLIGSAKTGNGVGDLIDLVCFLGEVFHRAKKNEDESAIIFKKQIHPEFGKIYYLKAIKEIHRNDVLYSSYGEIGFNQIFFIQSLSIEEESEVEEGDIFLAILSIDVPKNIILYNKEKKNLENKQKD